jgi:hypothetical protein|tara:strand:+ start:1592 stop:2041 length:450 start_codon:yes stop_codon:yes gene_type:complete
VNNPAQFADQPFNKRIEGMGDLAEGVFEGWCGVNYVRYGLNRPPLAMWKLPLRIRHTPDYLTSDYLVEVQGFGRKQIVQMKLDKWKSLLWWDRNVMPVRLFLHDSHNDRQLMFPIKKLRPLIDNAEVRKFPEGNEYYALSAGEVWSLLG